MLTEVLPRREQIILTAIDLLDEVGICGLTTKAIAQRQNITEAAIYKHFASKKDIIISILRRYALFDQSIKNTIIESSLEGREGILFLVKAYGDYYQRYPQIATPMFSFGVYHYYDDTSQMMMQIVQERYEFILQLLNQAVERDEISADADRHGLADALVGSVWGTTFLWKLNHCNFDLKARLLRSVEVLLPCCA